MVFKVGLGVYSKSGPELECFLNICFRSVMAGDWAGCFFFNVVTSVEFKLKLKLAEPNHKKTDLFHPPSPLMAHQTDFIKFGPTLTSMVRSGSP